MTLFGLLGVLAGYLLGAIPFGYLLVRLRRGEDVRARGSGSTGATNVTRVLGPVGGALTLALDVGKGYFAVVLARVLTEGDLRWMAAAAVAAIIGHSYPVYIRFRGGKSVATALGAFFPFVPLALLAALGVWAVALAIWRTVALASVLAAAAFPLFAYALYRPALQVTLAAATAACLIILRHRANLQRLVEGREPKFTLRRKS